MPNRRTGCCCWETSFTTAPATTCPRDYDPRAVTALLNGCRDRLLCVRGNCDAEVDQMVLEFPILANMP